MFGQLRKTFTYSFAKCPAWVIHELRIRLEPTTVQEGRERRCTLGGPSFAHFP